VNGVEDLSQRTLRELLTLARERLGKAAGGLKTRDELIAALSGTTPPAAAPAPVAPAPAAPQDEVVTRDFFVSRH
jgi:hypothetical protein